MKQKKERRITVRLTEEQYNAISAKAETAQMSPSTYMRTAALRHKIVVLEGLKEMTHELKGLDRNLNQLAILAYEERLFSPDLTKMIGTLENIYTRLGALTEKERR